MSLHPFRWLCAAAAVIAAGQAAYAQSAPLTILPGPTLVFVCDGAGGDEETSEGLREVMAETGLPIVVCTHYWSTGRGACPDHTEQDNHFYAGWCLANKVLAWRQAYPHARLVVVAYSSGAAVALAATLFLPPDSLDRMILMGSAVSHDYDLRAALRASREGIDAFYSPDDSTLPTAIDYLATADGKKCTPAGTCGFSGGFARQLEPLLFCKLRQRSWHPVMERVRHQGDHHGWAKPEFLSAYIVPLVGGPCLPMP